MEECKTVLVDQYTLGCSVHNRSFGECQSERIRFLELQVRDLWDLMISMPSGPGEGMVSDSADVQDALAWADKYRAVVAKWKPEAVTEKRVEAPRKIEHCGSTRHGCIKSDDCRCTCPNCVAIVNF